MRHQAGQTYESARDSVIIQGAMTAGAGVATGAVAVANVSTGCQIKVLKDAQKDCAQYTEDRANHAAKNVEQSFLGNLVGFSGNTNEFVYPVV